jgi:hypothetical protein
MKNKINNEKDELRLVFFFASDIIKGKE